MSPKISGSILAATIALAAAPGPAQTPGFTGEFQSLVYAGRTAEAASLAAEHLAAAPEHAQARFALGAVQFLRAIEHLGQGLHRYGLASDYETGAGLGVLPFLRLPVPENPAPEAVTYEGLRALLATLVADLDRSRETLAAMPTGEVDLPLNIGLLRLDMNSDGAGGDDEAIWRMVSLLGFPWLDAGQATKLETDFDASDVPWLMAYGHLLSAMAEFLLAHDWESAYAATFHGVFPRSGTPSAALADEAIRLRAEQAAMGEPPTPNYDNYPAWLATPEGKRFVRYSEIEGSLFYGGIADLIAFVHLNHWPVVEPVRMQSTLGHLEAMVGLSRENWRRILAETDDRREWIPNPKQTGVLPRMPVTDQQVAGWSRFLDEFEALLQGRKLLPHFRFQKGINLRRMFTEPQTFDLVLLIQGSAALPYLEEGELADAQTWDQIMQLMGEGPLGYFVWFN